MADLKWPKLIVFVAIVGSGLTAAAQQERAKLVQTDRAQFLENDFWIYNDLDAGIAKARQTHRPLLVVFR